MTKIGDAIVKIYSSLIFFLLMTLSASALAAVTVQSMVDRNEMGPGDTFTLTVAISTSEAMDMQEPRLPVLDGFDLINKWDQASVSQKLINTPKGMQFETQRRRDFNYMLSAKKQGSLSIDSFEVVVGGKVYRTQPVTIRVSEQSAGSGKNSRRKTSPQMGRPGMPPGFESLDDMDQAEEELFNQLLQQRQQMLQQFQGALPPAENGGPGNGGMQNPQFRSLPTNPNEAFFIQVEVDKTDVYEGEQITANWYLYTRGQMETLDRLKFPDLKGFWKEIIEEVPTIQFSEELVNGVPYKKALLASHALFPIKAGTSYIDEYKIKSRVRVPVGGMGGFYGQSYEFTKSSQKVPITVRALPTEGRPGDFAGAVGQFEMTAAVEGQSFPVNQPFSLKVRYEGAGNAKMIDLPALNLPPGIEVYDTKSESKFFKNGRSFKQFEVLIIPRQEGNITIPALSSSFFDSRAKKYYTKTTQALQVKIVANPNASVGGSNRIAGDSSPTKAKIREDVLPDVIVAWEKPAGFALGKNPWVWVALYAGILASLLWKAQREMGFGRRRQSLRDLVRRRMKKVDSALVAQDFRKVGLEMTNIFYLILGESVGEGRATQEITKLLEKASPSLRRNYASEIYKYFDIFQTLSFAPEEMLGSLKDPAVLKTDVAQARQLFAQIISTTSDSSSAETASV